MIRWEPTDPDRLQPQEKALLALCDRMAVLEQAFTAEREAHAMTRKRLDHVQGEFAREVASLRGKISAVHRDHRILFDLLQRED